MVFYHNLTNAFKNKAKSWIPNLLPASYRDTPTLSATEDSLVKSPHFISVKVTQGALLFPPLVSQPGPRVIFRHFFCLCPRVVWTSQFLFLLLLGPNVDFVPLGLNCSQQWKEEASLINESHSSSCDVSHLCLFSHPCPHPAPACPWSRGTPWPSWERLVPWGRWSNSISQREGTGKGSFCRPESICLRSVVLTSALTLKAFSWCPERFLFQSPHQCFLLPEGRMSTEAFNTPHFGGENEHLCDW